MDSLAIRKTNDLKHLLWNSNYNMHILWKKLSWKQNMDIEILLVSISNNLKESLVMMFCSRWVYRWLSYQSNYFWFGTKLMLVIGFYVKWGNGNLSLKRNSRLNWQSYKNRNKHFQKNEIRDFEEYVSMKLQLLNIYW